MTRFLAPLITMVLVVALGGCGKSEPAPPAPAPPALPAAPTAAAPAKPMPAAPAPEYTKVDLPEGTEYFPKDDWHDKLDPLASPDAIKGGRVNFFVGQAPESFNYYRETSYSASMIFGMLFESMLGNDPVTLESTPQLASRWAISPDKMTFTFWLDQRAHWSDGKPVTARDVEYTYQIVLDPKNETGPNQIALERFEPPTVIDDYTIQFHAKSVHWENLDAIGGLAIVPKHDWETVEFAKHNFEFNVVSGPYRLGKYDEGTAVTLERRRDWWAADFPSNRNKLNFDEIRYRFFGDRGNAYEVFKKGQLDIFPIYTSHRWMNETKGEAFDKNWIVKQKVMNHDPIGFQGFAMNMRKPPLNDPKVRLALAYCVDRKRMVETLAYNQYALHRSYYEDLYDAEHPCPNPMIPFDKEKARALLKEAGWVTNPKTGILEKDGEPLKLTLLERDSGFDKYIAIMQQDLRDVGVDLVVDKKDWAAWINDMNSFNYQITMAAWGAGVFKDPESMWASKEADRPSGNNITGFKNAKVDELIEKQKTIFDMEKRHDICRQVDQLVYAETPYILLWYIDYTRLLYWNKFGMPPQVLSKYGNESSVLSYWWIDPDSEADLEQAEKNGSELPRRPDQINYDTVMKQP